MFNFFLPLFRLSFWFGIQPVPFSLWIDRFILAVMFALLAASVACYVVANLAQSKGAWQERFDHDARRVLRRGAQCLFWASIVGFVLYGMTWQSIPVLSMRVLFVFWAAGFGWWGWQIVRYAWRELPLLRTRLAERAAYEKWLPKPKNSR